MKPWAKMLSVILPLVLGSAIGISQMGCLSPEDQASLAGFNTALTQASGTIAKDKATLESLGLELAKYRTSFEQVIADIKDKKTPIESGMKLLGEIMANINATQVKMADVQKLIDENVASAGAITASINDLKNKNVPWYYWLLPVGTAGVGIASMFVPGLSPLAQALQAVNGQLVSAQGQVAIKQEVGGSLSRTLDTVTAAADKALQDAAAQAKTAIGAKAPVIQVDLGSGPRMFGSLAELKAELMHAEQANDEQALKADYDAMRVEAAAKAI